MEKHFISFGNDLFTNQLKRVCNEAKKVGWFDKIIAETPSTIQDFMTTHKDFFDNNKRGFGYWLWKPYIILRQLNQMKDGDYLFYIDAGSSILPHRFYRLKEYFDYLELQPIWTSGSNGAYLEKQFQKISLLKRLNLENDKSFLESSMVEGGMIAIRKCEKSISLVKEWLSLGIEDDYKLINDYIGTDKQTDGFLEHRHDQSILSAIIKKEGYDWLTEDCYGIGPFFHSRMTDNGNRKFAPDWFRAESDYDHNIHPYLNNYLESKEDPKWWIKQSDYNPETMFKEEDYTNYKSICNI